VKAIAGAEFPFLARDLPTLNDIQEGASDRTEPYEQTMAVRNSHMGAQALMYNWVDWLRQCPILKA
jgi:hypothetical protein